MIEPKTHTKDNISPDASENPAKNMRSGLYYIANVGRFEATILWRSWLFRIFSLLTLSILLIFNLFGVLGIAGGGGWPGRFIPGNIVYFNVFSFTVAQVVIAAFLSADFLGRERKMDTTEVFYTRPMSNFHYVMGKTWGALMVFAGLNLVVILMALIVSLILPEAMVAPGPFFFFFFVYSVPSLLFILGFSFILMVLVRNQAVTFVLVLGFSAMVLFYFQNMHYGIWDFMGFYLPVHYSGFTGFSHFPYILMQRLVFLLLGLLGIFLTAWFLPRLPGHKRKSPILLVSSFVVVLLAGFLVFNILSSARNGRVQRQDIVTKERNLSARPEAQMKSCHLKVSHSENQLDCEALLTLKTGNSDSLFFALNSGFTINEVIINQQSVAFSHSSGILSVKHLKSPISKDSTLRVRIAYSGAPDNQTIFPYTQESDRQLLNRLDPLVAGKDHVFVTGNFVLLTRESGWYPQVAWRYYRQQPAFTSFALDFQSEADLQVFSQGRAIKDGSLFRFRNEKPLNALSLVAGQYNADSVNVDEIEYQLAVNKENALISNNFDEVTDTLPSLIRQLKGQYERKLKMAYPFKYLKIVEVPIHYFTYLPSWTSATDHTHPEFVFLPEYGAGSWHLDVKRTRNDFEEEAESQGKDPNEADIQARMFITLVGNAFLYPRWMIFDSGQEVERDLNNWSRNQIFPLYYNYAYQMQEEGFPVFGIMLEEALRKKSQKSSNDFRTDNSKQYESLLALKRKSLADWLSRETVDDTIAGLLNLQGIQFFTQISALSETDDFVDEIQQPLSDLKFQNSKPADWLNSINLPFDLSEDYQKVLKREILPAFQFGKLHTSQFRKDGKNQYFVSVEVFNYSEADGILDTRTSFLDLTENQGRSFSQWMLNNVEEEQNEVQKLFMVPGNSKVRLNLFFDHLPGEIKINTGVAENVPPLYIFPLGNFETEKPKLEEEGMVFLDSVKTPASDPGIYIVDNEDDGFVIESKDEIKTLKDWWLQQQINQIDDYHEFRYWNPPPVWTSSLGDNFYGEYLRSAVLKASGNGDDKVYWTCDLLEEGSYDVQVYIPMDLNLSWRQQELRGVFRYNVHYAGGVERVESSDVQERNGWVSLGRFFFEKGRARIELSDRTNFPYVVADAVKWVKIR